MVTKLRQANAKGNGSSVTTMGVSRIKGNINVVVGTNTYVENA
jgi:hypothetical protein